MKFIHFISVLLIIFWGCSPSTIVPDGPGVTQQRYKEPIFSEVLIETDINYGNSLNEAGSKQALFLDFYTTAENYSLPRPLLVLVPGGGFSSNTNKSTMKDLAIAIAQYGYAVAVINYRTHNQNNTIDNALWKKLILQGVQDAKAAIRFFRRDAESVNRFQIDPEKIFIGGHSTGGMVASHLAYLQHISQADSEFQGIIAANGGLEGDSGNSGYQSTVSGVINLSGAILDKNYILEGAVPLLGIYATGDIVIAGGDAVFSYPPSIEPIIMSGIVAMHERATEVGIKSNTLLAISGGDHGSAARANCASCLSAITAFMFNLL